MDLSTSHPAHTRNNVPREVRVILTRAAEVQRNLDDEWLYAASRRSVLLHWRLHDLADAWSGVLEEIRVASTFLAAARKLALDRAAPLSA